MSLLTSGLALLVLAAPPKVAVHERLATIENGQLKIGVDLNHGGAITWLSAIGTNVPSGIRDRNLVNNFDLGRQIQMSHYAAPIPFKPNGEEPFDAWKTLGWNAVQAGDHFGNGSFVLQHHQGEETLAITSRPRQWPLDGVDSEATFETTITLQDDLAIVDCVVRCTRRDSFDPRPRHQEIPAVYVVSRFDRILSPISGQLAKVEQSEPGRWEYWTASEPWAMAVDSDGWGLGVYAPEATEFVGGYHGKSGSWDERAAATTYFAPLMTSALKADETLAYQFVLKLGQQVEIAERFGKLHEDSQEP